jgi:hypothetical protein
MRFTDSERSVTCRGMIWTAAFRQQLLQERSGLTVSKLLCKWGLQMPEFGLTRSGNSSDNLDAQLKPISPGRVYCHANHHS